MADDELIEDALRDGLAHRVADVEIPAGMGRRGRRIARRRSARRAGVGAVPALAVVIAAALLLLDGRGLGPRGVDARYVVRHARAQLMQITSGGGVLETIGPRAGMVGWLYVDRRHHTSYRLTRYTHGGGSLSFEKWSVERRLPGQRFESTALRISARARTWSLRHRVIPGPQSAFPDVQTLVRLLVRALTNGHVTYQGKARQHGRAVLDFQVQLHIWGRGELVVDASTYRLISCVTHMRAGGQMTTSGLYVRSASPANIARVMHRPEIPAGFRRVASPSGF